MLVVFPDTQNYAAIPFLLPSKSTLYYKVNTKILVSQDLPQFFISILYLMI
jgi:hypothetical protein